MGENKLDKMLPNGKSLLQHAIQQLGYVDVDNIMLSGHELAGFESLRDILSNVGPMGGIHAAVNYAPQSDWLILPVDMPLLSQGLLQRLVAAARNEKRSCYYEDYCLPLYIVGSDSLANSLENMFAGPKSPSVWHFCREIKAMTIETNETSLFLNANTPQDWNQVQEALD